jgi:predicted Zn-dependent protease
VNIVGHMLSAALVCLLAQAPAKAPAEKDLLLDTLVAELDRSKKGLKGEPDAPVFYLSYRVADGDTWGQSASFGALEGSQSVRGALVGRMRILDVSVRVGTRQLDNTHRLRGGSRWDMDVMGRPLPVEDEPGPLSVALWRATHDAYKSATRGIIRVRANVAVKASEDDKAADFSDDKAHQQIDARAPSLQTIIDTKAWEDRVRKLSAMFKTHPELLRGSVAVQMISSTHYFVDSEGARLREPRFSARVMLNGTVRAADGMDLELYDSVEASTFDGLPDDAELTKRTAKLIERLEALKKAPAIEPWAGPAIITNRAAGVFFHEIFGHRIEGHRQKDADEGQTFTKRLGKSVVPDFISVVDDPTRRDYLGTPLNGFYEFDEEGQPAQRATLVDHGILKGFLTGRTPINEFKNSNGHGRAMPGLPPVSRQGNLIVDSSKQLSIVALREKLIAELKAKGKPFGLWFEEISGGFTNTRTGGLPQAFKVLPQVVFKVYADGRPDELVRGVDIVGTPLTSFERILATGDDFKIFNGYCGAESGWVPVSAVAPSLLVGEIEVERRAKGHERAPILPPPPMQPNDGRQVGRGSEKQPKPEVKK